MDMETMEYGTKEKTLRKLVRRGLKNAMTYADYRALITQMALKGKTTGVDQGPARVDYTLLNAQRMKRLDRTLKIDSGILDQIKVPVKRQQWLVLTESWCADAAQTLPVMNRIASLVPEISLRIILRDENLGLMQHFTTDGTLSIPKLIVIDRESGAVLGNWGPRPSVATCMVTEFKQAHGTLTADFKKELQLWYNQDKGKNTLEDLLRLLTLEEVGDGAPLLGAGSTVKPSF
jgi:hypothetical protein